MLKHFCFFLLLASAVNAEETCCVDEDIAAAFMQMATYSRVYPDSFPVKLDNPSLELIGSSTGHAGRQISVAWKSELDPNSARQLIADVLSQENWLAIPQSDSQRAMFSRGFVPHQSRAVEDNQQFCRDREGQLTIRARTTQIGTVATLSHYAPQAGMDCAATIAAQRNDLRYTSGLISYLPVLKLPESIAVSPYAGSGSGGGSHDAHAEISLDSTVLATDLMSSFDGQMVAQGWRMDASFQGSTTMGTTWLRDVEELKLACMVTAISGADDKVRLRMHLESIR